MSLTHYIAAMIGLAMGWGFNGVAYQYGYGSIHAWAIMALGAMPWYFVVDNAMLRTNHSWIRKRSSKASMMKPLITLPLATCLVSLSGLNAMSNFWASSLPNHSKMKWITDQMPDDGVTVLCIWSWECIHTAQRHGIIWHVPNCPSDTYDKPTGWLPLGALPTLGK